jgi:hypothetical protein
MKQSKQNSQCKQESWIQKSNFMQKFLSEKSNKIIKKIQKKYMKSLVFSLLFAISASAQWSDAILFQNQIRSYYNLPPLSYDNSLSIIAQNWAKHMAVSGVFKTSDDGYGENIYVIDKKWADENTKNLYLDATLGWVLNMDTDERMMTQIISPKTSKIGFGIAENTESIYVVAKYDKYYK